MQNSENIASIYIDAILSTKKLEKQLLDLEKQTRVINLGLDDKKIADFRQSIERKFQECIPVKLCVDDSQLRNFRIQNLNTVQKLYIPAEIDDRNILRSVNEVKKKVEATQLKISIDNSYLQQQINKIQTQKPNITFVSNTNVTQNKAEYEKMGQMIGKTINAQIKGNLFTNLFDRSIGRVFTGAFEGIGRDLTRDFSKSFTQSLQQGLNQAIGSSTLVGDALGKKIVDAIASNIPKELGEELQSAINEVLGEKNILIAKNASTRNITRGSERRETLAQEQIALDRRESLRNYRTRNLELRSVDSSLTVNQEAQVKNNEQLTKLREKAERLENTVTAKKAVKIQEEITQTTKRLKDLDYQSKVQVDPEILASIATQQTKQQAKLATLNELASNNVVILLQNAITEVSQNLEALFESEAKLLDEKEKLNKIVLEAKKRVDNSKKAFDAVMPESLPQIYAQALKDITGKSIPASKAPKLVVDDKALADGGMNAAYAPESNSMLISISLKRDMDAGRLNEKDTKTLYHEVEHAFDLDFGSLKGLEANRNNVTVTRPLTPTKAELAQISPLIAMYDPKDRLIEMNAEVAGIRKGGKAYQIQERIAQSANLLQTFGKDAQKIKDITGKQLDNLKESLFQVASFAKNKGVDVKDDLQSFLSDISQAKANVAKTTEKIIAGQNQQLPVSELEKLEEDLKAQLNDLEKLDTKLNIFKLETLKKAKALVKPTVNIKEVEKVLIPDPWLDNQAKVAKANQQIKASQAKSQNLNSVQKNERIPIINASQFDVGYSDIKARILPSFKALFKDIQSDLKVGKLDFIDDQELGALAKAKTLLDAIKFAREDIEKVRSESGASKIGSSEAAKLNNALSQLKQIENKVKRELTVARNKIANQGGADDSGENLRARLDPLKVAKNSTDEEKKQVKALNDLLDSISDNIDDFEFKFVKANKKVSESFDQSIKAVREFSENFLKPQENVGKFEEIISGVFNNLDKVVLSFAGVAVLANFGEQLNEFRKQAIQTAKEMQSINRQVIFAAGGGSQGQKYLQEIRKTAEDLRLNVKDTLTASSGFATATEGTSIEGQLGTETFKNFQKLLAARSTERGKASNFLLALEQSASKGLQAEELRGQMAEAVPGIISIFARSQGQSNKQFLDAMRRTTGGLDQSVLFDASQQAAAESQLSLQSSFETLDSSINNLDNKLTNLQEKAGNALLPLEKFKTDALAGSIEFITNNVELLSKAILVIGIHLNTPLIRLGLDGLKKGFEVASVAVKSYIADIILSAQIQTAGMSKMQAGSFLLAKGFDIAKTSALGIMKAFAPMVGIAVGLELVTATFNALRITFSDLSGDIGKFVESAKNANKQLLDIGKNAKPGDEIDFANKGTQANKVNSKRGFLASLNPFDTTLLEGNKKALDTLKATKALLAEAEKLRGISESPKVFGDLEQLNQIDNKLKDIRVKSAALAQTRPGDSEALKKLRAEESALAKERADKILSVGGVQSALEARITELKSAKDELKQQAEAGFIFKDNYVDNVQEIDDELKKLEKRQDEITKAVGKTKTAFQQLQTEITKLNAYFEDVKLTLENTSILRETAINKLSANNQINQGTAEYLRGTEGIRQKKTLVNEQQKFINISQNNLRNPEADRILKAYNLNALSGVNEINLIASRVENEQSKFILEEFAKFQQTKQELAKNQADLAQAQNQFRTQLVDQTRQVGEYYQSITRQVKEAKLEFQKQINQINTNNAATRIRAALGDSEDSFLNTFVDNLISQIESINNIANSKLDLQTKNLQSAFQNEDSLKAQFEISRNIPSIPVKLDLENIDSDENVQALNQEFSDTKDLVNQVNQGVSFLDERVQKNARSFELVNSEIEQNLNSVQKIDSSLQTVNSSTNLWQSSLNLITSETSTINEKFQGLGGLISSLTTQTATWLANLANAPNLLGSLANGVASLFNGGNGQAQPNLLQQGINFLTGGNQSGSQGVLKPVGNAPVTSGFGNRFIFGAQQFHAGIDYGVPTGTPVKAPTSGRISRIFESSGGGKTVELESIDSAGKKIVQQFLHLSEYVAKVGENVKQGDVIAKSGNTGKRTTGAHLDWRIKINGDWIDPKKFLGMNINIPEKKGTSNQQGSTTLNSPSKSLNASGIAKQNNLQSLLVTDSNGKVVSQYNSLNSPASPASTIKLILADVVSDKLDPKTNLKINSSGIAQYEDKFKSGQIASVGTLLESMLKDSNNTAFNTLIQGLGGVKAANQLIKQKGYSGTSLNSFLSTSQSTGTNKSNAVDVTKAMRALLSGDSPGDLIAKQALRQTRNFNYSGEDGGKIGNNSKVIGNVGIVNINGKEYIVTAYANVDGNKLNNRKLITNATNAVNQSLRDSNAIATSSNNRGGIQRGGNLLTPQEAAKLTPLGKKLTQYVQNPNVLAIGDVIARAEGTDFRGNSKNFGYTMRIGGSHATSLNTHGFTDSQGNRNRPLVANSTAFGRYQMMDFNWSQRAAKRMNPGWRSDLSDVFQGGDNPGSASAGVQDLYLVYSLYKRGVLDEVLKGDLSSALKNPNLAKHYASLQSGSGRSAYRGQGTPEGQLNSTLSFAQQRLQARLNPAQNAAIRNNFLSPQALQGQINQGGVLQRESISQNAQLNTLQNEADTLKNQQEFRRRQESQLNNLRKNLSENFDLRISTARKTADLANSANPIKSTQEQFSEGILRINREYDDIILEITRKSDSISRSLTKSKELLNSGEVTGENKNLLTKKIADDEKTLGSLRSELSKVQKLRNEAITTANQNFSFEENQRQLRIDFEKDSQSLDKLKAQLEGLKALQSTQPLNSKILEIPDIERTLQLKEEELNLNRQLADLENRKFKKELNDSQYAEQAENLKKLSIQKRDNIQLNYELAKSEQSLKVSGLKLEYENRFYDLAFAKRQEEIRKLQTQKKTNPLVDSDFTELRLNAGLQIAQQERENLKRIQSEKEFARSLGLSEQATQVLIDRVNELNNLKLDNIKQEFEQAVGEERIRNLEVANERTNRLNDFVTTRNFNRRQQEIDLYKARGGNQFTANAQSRVLGKEQEKIRFAKEQREFEIEISRMRQSQIPVDENAIANVRQDMEAIHNLNLANINQQFKTFGQTLNEIGNQSIQGLSSGLTELIMGTKSLSEVMDNFFNNLLSQVLNAGINSLLSGMFGGGGGLLGGIFGGLFSQGGIVPNYAKGKSPLELAFAKERRESGLKPYLAVVHENELIIPASRASQLANQGLTSDMLLGNFANGGVVGDVAKSGMTKSVTENTSSQTKNINIEITRINEVNYVTEDQLRLAMREATQQGAELGVNKVQSKMQNSISFRNSTRLR
jgi:murein DD-endopeptidase MepM/ murein hydrolase activator NlpD/muramidase (phage lysozyme)